MAFYMSDMNQLHKAQSLTSPTRSSGCSLMPEVVAQILKLTLQSNTASGSEGRLVSPGHREPLDTSPRESLGLGHAVKLQRGNEESTGSAVAGRESTQRGSVLNPSPELSAAAQHRGSD